VFLLRESVAEVQEENSIEKGSEMEMSESPRESDGCKAPHPRQEPVSHVPEDRCYLWLERFRKQVREDYVRSLIRSNPD